MGAPGDIRSARRGWSLALVVGAFVVGLAPLADGDLWWHLAAGREMARTHAFLTTDPFSAGAAGRPWIDVHWLFQLATYGVYVIGGLRAIVLGKCLVVAAGALVLGAAVARGAGTRALALFVPAFVGALFAARALLLPRPVVPTLLFLAVDFALLEAFRRDGRMAWLVPLPFLQVLWSNVQALSMLGPCLVATYSLAAIGWRTLGARRWFPFAPELDAGVDAARAARALVAALALCAAACLATPYGARALALPFGLLGRFWPGAGNVYGANVAENVPPGILERTSPGQFGHLWPYLALLAACLAAAPRLVLSRLVVVVALVALALAGNRNVLLLYWLATPIAVMSVAPALRRLRVALRRWRAPRVAARWGALAAMAAVLAVASVAAARETSLGAPAPWRAPVQSAEIIAARGGTGTVFAADQFGDYLIWRLGPEHRPFMDTRLVLRTASEFQEYLSVVDEPARFDAWERDQGFEYVLLPVAYPDRYLPLIAHLYGSDRWQLVYTDGAETLFARRPVSLDTVSEAWSLKSPAVVDRIVADLARRFRDEPRLHEAARASLATLLLAVGAPREAERALEGLATTPAEALRARCRLAAGDLDGAERIAQATLERAPSDVTSIDVLAVVAARRSESERARELLRRALDLNPYDVEARDLLARSEGQ